MAAKADDSPIGFDNDDDDEEKRSADTLPDAMNIALVPGIRALNFFQLFECDHKEWDLPLLASTRSTWDSFDHLPFYCLGPTVTTMCICKRCGISFDFKPVTDFINSLPSDSWPKTNDVLSIYTRPHDEDDDIPRNFMLSCQTWTQVHPYSLLPWVLKWNDLALHLEQFVWRKEQLKNSLMGIIFDYADLPTSFESIRDVGSKNSAIITPVRDGQNVLWKLSFFPVRMLPPLVSVGEETDDDD